MRNLFSLLFILAAFSAQAQLTNGLVAHWPFNGNTSDSTGNMTNGTATNITYTAGRTGVANTAALFNGTSSKIAFPYTPQMNVSQMTLCAIVKFNNFYSGSCQHSMILQRGSFFANGSYSLSVYENAYDGGDCNNYDSTKMVFHQKIANVESSITLDSFKHSPNVNKNQWYCVFSTYDGSRVRLYINGVQHLSYSSSQSFGTSSEGMAIGANTFNQSSTYPYWLNGAIDDIKLYNRVLTAIELDSLCKNSVASVNNVFKEQDAILYPVPAHNSLNVIMNNTLMAGGSLTIFNNIGQAVSKTNIIHESVTIDISSLPPGIYNVKVTDDSGYCILKRFSKQ